MTRLKLDHLNKNYGNVKAVQGVSLEVKEKSFIVLAGPSGCGKTTLLHMIAGFLKCDHGDIFVDEESIINLEPDQRGIAMVFQDAALFPDMSVKENIEIGLAYSGLVKEEIEERVHAMASLVDISNLLDRKAHTLSNGQKQRVSIARALVRRPKLFLMDEPLSALDARLKSQLRIEIAMLYQKMDSTFIYVTHDQVEAMTMADTLVIMKDGRFQQIGKPMDIYQKPCNLFTASFLGKYEINQFHAKIKNQQIFLEEHILADVKGKENQDIIIGVRPEYLHRDDKDGFIGKVVLVEHLGDEVFYHIEREQQIFIMKGNVDESVCCGDMYYFNFHFKDAFCFDAISKVRLILE